MQSSPERDHNNSRQGFFLVVESDSLNMETPASQTQEQPDSECGCTPRAPPGCAVVARTPFQQRLCPPATIPITPAATCSCSNAFSWQESFAKNDKNGEST
mmetsp:Transcript_10900/g.20739  ORF Transcript_10900/g.20739 Transcript_10900/m.20739 type:complete len:101 (+) Transcript_10900:1389-1691(+)